MDFGSILVPFWEALGTILGAKMPSKIERNVGCDFGGQTEGGSRFFWLGPAECAGPVGRIMEGYGIYKNPGGDEDKAKEIPGWCLARRPEVGRRNVSRIPWAALCGLFGW